MSSHKATIWVWPHFQIWRHLNFQMQIWKKFEVLKACLTGQTCKTQAKSKLMFQNANDFIHEQIPLFTSVTGFAIYTNKKKHRCRRQALRHFWSAEVLLSSDLATELLHKWSPLWNTPLSALAQPSSPLPFVPLVFVDPGKWTLALFWFSTI